MLAQLTVGSLAALVDKSLVVADTTRSPTRYRLLETVRARAAHRMPANLPARHAEYLVRPGHLVRRAPPYAG